MRILAFDTSTEYCSAALYLSGQLAVREELAGQTHSDRLLVMLRELLGEAGVALSQLDAIAFGEGPGSFTGLRIACGVAQGIGLGAGLPVIPVNTLEALAEANGADRVFSCLDARMGELYCAAYERNAGQWQEIVAPLLCAPHNLPALPGAGWAGTGTGFAAHGDAIRQHYGQALQCGESAFPHAGAIASVATARGMQSAVDAGEVYPLYIRNKVAKKMGER